MAYNLACWCIQMAYTQHSWMLMDIVVGLSVRPSVRLFVYGIFRWLCICWQITWNKWHKIWHDDVVIIGRWLLPSLVDTGDICCHYWQLILVIMWLTELSCDLPVFTHILQVSFTGTGNRMIAPVPVKHPWRIYQALKSPGFFLISGLIRAEKFLNQNKLCRFFTFWTKYCFWIVWKSLLSCLI